jgi:hypothetical protein
MCMLCFNQINPTNLLFIILLTYYSATYSVFHCIISFPSLAVPSDRPANKILFFLSTYTYVYLKDHIYIYVYIYLICSTYKGEHATFGLLSLVYFAWQHVLQYHPLTFKQHNFFLCYGCIILCFIYIPCFLNTFITCGASGLFPKLGYYEQYCSTQGCTKDSIILEHILSGICPGVVSLDHIVFLFQFFEETPDCSL